jgi:putative Holliday junction resolvase
VDLGARRIGLAWSDASATLARPWMTMPAGASPRESALAVEAAARRYLQDAEEPLAGVVVGWPRRLSGEDTHATAGVRTFAEALRDRGLAVYLQDERLSSREAEARLAVRERDWRVRKRRIDAAAAAIVLQDFLDGQSRSQDSPELTES